MTDRTEYFKQWRKEHRAKRAEYQRAFRAKQKVVTCSKPCIRCGEVKPLDNFIPDVRFADGYRNICRLCFNVDQRRYHEKRKTQGIQLDLMPGKIATSTHRGYPPFGKCPCRECRNAERQRELQRFLDAKETTQFVEQLFAAQAGD